MTRRTPATDPDDAVIGRTFRAHGILFLCDSYDPAYGYWMTPVNAADAEPFRPNHRATRRNVSEQAIGRTFHRIGQ